MVDRRVGADDENDFGVGDVAHLVRHRAGVDAFHQRGDARGVAEARAVVDVVRPEPGAHELLEKIGLLVGALRRAEAGERPLAVGVADVAQPLGGEVERFLPRRFAEHLGPVVRIDGEVLVLGDARLADQRLRQAVLVLHVVEAVAPLDAQAARVRRTVLALHEEDLVVLDVVGELAPDAAVRAHRVDRLLGTTLRDLARGHQRAGRTRLDAFAAGHAGRVAHRVVEVEHDLRVTAAKGVADDVVDLFLAAGAHAAAALDAGVEVDRNRGMRDVLRPAGAGRAKRGLPMFSFFAQRSSSESSV